MGSFIRQSAQESMLDDLFLEEFDSMFLQPEDAIWKGNEQPVPIDTFINDGDFLGLRGRIYNGVDFALNNIERPDVREIALSLGKGSGKTTALQIYMVYGVYQLLMMKNPQEYYELLPGTPITELLVSTSEKQAKYVGFAGVKNLIDRCPWFKGRYEALATEIRFENDINLYCGHSGATAWLGFNTVRAAMDEVEYMRDTNNRSVSKELYRALKGSLTTRFPDKYKLLMISSVKEQYSFLYQKFTQVKEEGTQIVYPEKFNIPVNVQHIFENPHGVRKELLDELVSLEVEAFEKEATFVMKAPTWKMNPKASLETFLDDFYTDEPGSLRDYASIPTHSLTPFFPDASLLDRKAHHDENGCPIILPTYTMREDFKPHIEFKYFFAGDLSVSGDRTGISMVHYDYYANKVFLDFSLAVLAKRGERVDYAPIRQFIKNLRDRGFNIAGVAFDQFQSNDSINMLIQDGFNAFQVNYAESFVGCTQLQELIFTDKFVYADWNDIFIQEAKELQIINSKRIDHLQNGGKANAKDCWDSCVNATYSCLQDWYKNGNIANENQKVSRITEKLLKRTNSIKLDDPNDFSWIM